MTSGFHVLSNNNVAETRRRLCWPGFEDRRERLIQPWSNPSPAHPAGCSISGSRRTVLARGESHDEPSLYLASSRRHRLMLIPALMSRLIVANSVAHGPRYGLLTVAGTSSAMILQLGLVALGMNQFLG